jgi:hypothetical protein
MFLSRCDLSFSPHAGSTWDAFMVDNDKRIADPARQPASSLATANDDDPCARLDVDTLDDELWQAVRARHAQVSSVFEPTTKAVRAARAKRLYQTRRPAFLSSGLLTCGACSGRYGVILGDRYGCLNHFRRGTCENNRTIRRPVLEQRVHAGLTEKLVSPDAVAQRCAHIMRR